MQGVTQFLVSLALLGLVVAGFATILGASSVRKRMFTFAALAVGLALAVPLVFGMAEHCSHSVTSQLETTGLTLPPGFVIPVVLGHVVLGAVLLRRRLRDPERSRHAATELERARARERTRLPPDPEEPS